MERIIGIDIADTIIEVWPSLIEKASEFNISHSNNKISKDKNLYLPEDIYNWTNEEKSLFWSLYRDELFFSMPIKQGVKETLDLLKSLSIKIYFITAKSNKDYLQLEKKIIKLLSDNSIPYDKIFTQVENKGLLCHEENVSYLIDDSYSNCLSALNYKKVALLMNNPYNENRDILENMFRIHEFDEIKQYILK